jgi:ferric-dicitrate binding protein FerR (iron transport regulator)
MLSDAEQRRLTEIELSLRADDPRFARRFDARANRRPRRRWQAVVALLVAIAALVGVIVGLVLGNVATVVFAVTAFGVAAGIWGTPRRGQSGWASPNFDR